MGSLLNSPRMAAFQSQIYPRGLDLARCVIQQDVGTFQAASGASWEQGMILSLDASGYLVKGPGIHPFGVAKWNLTQSFTAAIVDEVISFSISGGTASLKHASISNFQLRSAANFGGSLYQNPRDFTNVDNLFTHSGGGSTIPVGSPVYVSYTYQLLASDLDFEGRNFWNFTDDVTIANGRITVITDNAILFTTMYDTSQVYTTTGTGSNLYCGGGVGGAANIGLFTNAAAEIAAAQFVGNVIQVPTANDPFLGLRLFGQALVTT